MDILTTPIHGDNHPVTVLNLRESRNLLYDEIANKDVTAYGVRCVFEDDGIVRLSGNKNTTANESSFHFARYNWSGTMERLLPYAGKELYITVELVEGVLPYNVVWDIWYHNGETWKTATSLTFKPTDGSIRHISFTLPETNANGYRSRLYINSFSGGEIDVALRYMLVDYPEYDEYEKPGMIEEPIFIPAETEKTGRAVDFDRTYNDAAEVTMNGYSEQTTLSGKNLVVGADDLSGWHVTESGVGRVTFEDNIASVKGSSSDWDSAIHEYPKMMYSTVKDKKVVLSFDVMKMGDSGSTDGAIVAALARTNTEKKGVNRNQYRSFTVAQSSTLTPNVWTRLTYVTDSLTEDYFTSNTKVDDAVYLFIELYNRSTDTIKFRNVQLEIGSSATSYEPYCGGMPSPNPYYPQDILSVGKSRNLAKSYTQNKASNPYVHVLWIDTESDLEPNTDYRLSLYGTKDNKVYANENLFTYKTFTILDGLTILELRTKDTVSRNNTSQYSKNQGWVILKNNSGNAVVASFDKIMFEKGDKSTPYVPYNSLALMTGGRNLVGTDKADLNNQGNTGVSTTLNSDGSIHMEGTANTNTYPGIFGRNSLSWKGMPEGMIIGETYTIFDCGVQCMNSERILRSANSISLGRPTQITIPEGTEGIFVYSGYAAKGQTINRDFYPMIERGLVAHPYEPYVQPTATYVDLDGHELRSLPDGTHDELWIFRDGSKKIIQRVDRIYIGVSRNLDMLNDSSESSLSGSIAKFVKNKNGDYKTTESDNKALRCRSSHFTNRLNTLAKASVGEMRMNGTIWLLLPDEITTLAQANSFCAENNVYLDLALVEPRVIDLPKGDPIPTIYPTTVIYDQDGNDITANVRIFEVGAKGLRLDEGILDDESFVLG